MRRKFQESSPSCPGWTSHMLGMWCAQVGMGILDKLAAHKQHNNSIHQLMHLKLLSNQMQATCQYVTEYSNSMRLACSRPLPQARGGPQPMWWLCGGLAGPCQEIKIKLVWPTMVWPMALQPMPYTVVWGPWLWAFWAHSVFFKPTKWHKKCVQCFFFHTRDVFHTVLGQVSHSSCRARGH